MITRDQLGELEEWLTDQSDLEIDYSLDMFGFTYAVKLDGKYLTATVYYDDGDQPLGTVRRHVEAARKNPGLGSTSAPESLTNFSRTESAKVNK